MSSLMDTLGDIARQTGNAFGQALKSASAPAQEKPPVPRVNLNIQAQQPARVMALTCPKCNASIQAGGGRGFTFCPYCGSQLLVNDGTTTVTYRTVDETRIRELELEAERARIEAEHERLQIELDEKHRPGKVRLSIALAIIGAIMMAVGWIGATTSSSPIAWVLLAIVGSYPIIAIAYIWMKPLGNSNNNDDGHKR